MQLLDLKYGAFGLDISDSSVKIVKLEKKRGKFVVASYGQTKLKPGTVELGIIKNAKELAEAIRLVYKTVKGKKLKAEHAVISLPEEQSFLQVIQMPKMTAEELKSAILFEAENYIPMPIKQVYLDFQVIEPIKDDLDHVDVLVAAMPMQLVDAYLLCIKAAGLTTLAAELESQSIARALIKNDTSEFPVVILDIGNNNINFIVFSGHAIRFTSSLSMQATEENLGELAEQIKKYINFYQEHASHEHLFLESKVKKIILCGGGSSLKKLPEFLTEKLGIKTELGNPFINSPLLKNAAQDAGFLPYATALGSALGGVNIEND